MPDPAGPPDRPGMELISCDVSLALAEDIGTGDCTAGLIPEDTKLATRVICRQHAVLAGLPWFNETFRQLDPRVAVHWNLADGEAMLPDQEICRINGPAASILSGERTALNFLQTLSASASLARQYVNAVAGTQAIILDTRKTLPGLRRAQKYAVGCGGAQSHRVGLFDAILIKENHLAALGSISAAIECARAMHPGLLLEVEVETLEQLAEASMALADRALLDNFNISLLERAVDRYSGRIELEASGGINLQTVKEIAQTGVDFISVGDLTKNISAVDFSMRFL